MPYQIESPVEFALQQARLLPEQPRRALYERPGFRNFEEQASAALESLPKDKAFQDTLIFFGLMCAAFTNIRKSDQSHHGPPQTQPEQDDSNIVIVVNSWVIASMVRLSLSKRTELSRKEVSSALDSIIEDFEIMEDEWGDTSLNARPDIDMHRDYLRRALSAARDCRDFNRSYQKSQHAREQTEKALRHKFLLLYASTRDTSAIQQWTPDEEQALGKRILEASRVKDEATLKVELLDELLQRLLFIADVPKAKIPSLASLLANLTGVGEVAERLVPTLKDLSQLPRSGPVELIAVVYMSQACMDLEKTIREMAHGHSYWDFLPPELLRAIFSFLDTRSLRDVRLVSEKWLNTANDFLCMQFSHDGCEQIAKEFLRLAPLRLPLEITSCWYPLELHEVHLDTMLAPLHKLKSISLKLQRVLCPRCKIAQRLDLDHLETTLFWKICELVEREGIRLKSLTYSEYYKPPPAQVLARLGENFPLQYRSLEELTISSATHFSGLGMFSRSSPGLNKLRIELVSLRFPSDIYWEHLSHLQIRIQRISRDDLRDFTSFLQRHSRLKRVVVLCVGRLRRQVEEDEEEQLIADIRVILRDIEHDVRIVATSGDTWVE